MSIIFVQPLAIPHDEHKTHIMESKIRIEHDFSKNEPYIQFYVQKGDVNDAALENFIYQAISRGICIDYPKDNPERSVARIRPLYAKERELHELEAVAQMCAESLDPRLYANFTEIYEALKKIRASLQE